MEAIKMHKRIIILLLSILFIGHPLFAQEPDSVKFSYEEVKSMTRNIKELQKKEKLQRQEIKKLDQTIKAYKFIEKQDSLIITRKDKQIQLLKEEIQLYKEKDSFWNSETWGFIKGVALVGFSSWIVSNIQ